MAFIIEHHKTRSTLDIIQSIEPIIHCAMSLYYELQHKVITGNPYN